MVAAFASHDRCRRQRVLFGILLLLATTRKMVWAFSPTLLPIRSHHSHALLTSSSSLILRKSTQERQSSYTDMNQNSDDDPFFEKNPFEKNPFEQKNPFHLRSSSSSRTDIAEAQDQVVNYYKILNLNYQPPPTTTTTNHNGFANDPSQPSPPPPPIDPHMVKTAFRRLAKRYHPDLNPDVDTTAHFQQVNRAYEMLQRQYCQDDIRGGTVRFDLWLEADAARRGGVHHLRVPRLDTCVACHGNGVVWQPAAPYDGRYPRNALAAKAVTVKPILYTLDCPSCNNGCGEGAIDSSCTVCDGTGYILAQKSRTTTPTTTSSSSLQQQNPNHHPNTHHHHHHHHPEDHHHDQVTCRTCLGQGVVEGAPRVRVGLPPLDFGEAPVTHRDKVSIQVLVPHEGDAGPLCGPRGDLQVWVHIKPLNRQRLSAFDQPSPFHNGFGGSSLSP